MHRAGEQAVAGKHRAHRGNQADRLFLFGQIARGAGLEAAVGIERRWQGREYQQFEIGVHGAEPSEDFQAVEFWNGDIQDDQIGPQ
ncbi:hypothetical protein D9M68_959670 [compost metagenome]